MGYYYPYIPRRFWFSIIIIRSISKQKYLYHEYINTYVGIRIWLYRFRVLKSFATCGDIITI